MHSEKWRAAPAADIAGQWRRAVQGDASARRGLLRRIMPRRSGGLHAAASDPLRHIYILRSFSGPVSHGHLPSRIAATHPTGVVIDDVGGLWSAQPA